jgi:hypothetical protein
MDPGFRRDDGDSGEKSPLNKRNARSHLPVHMKKTVPLKTKPKARKAEADIAEPDWAAIQLLYEDAAQPLTTIAEFTGLTWQKIVAYARWHGWHRCKAPKLADVPAAELMGAALRPSHLATRLKRLIAREIETIEGESAAKRDALQKERDARRLSSLVRTLEKLNDIKAAKSKRDPKSGDGAADGDALRAELLRRLARLAAGDGAGDVSAKPDTGGSGVAA